MLIIDTIPRVKMEPCFLSVVYRAPRGLAHLSSLVIQNSPSTLCSRPTELSVLNNNSSNNSNNHPGVSFLQPLYKLFFLSGRPFQLLHLDIPCLFVRSLFRCDSDLWNFFGFAGICFYNFTEAHLSYSVFPIDCKAGTKVYYPSFYSQCLVQCLEHTKDQYMFSDWFNIVTKTKGGEYQI